MIIYQLLAIIRKRTSVHTFEAQEIMISSSVRISEIKCFKRKKKHTKNHKKINNNEKQVSARKAPNQGIATEKSL